MLKIAQNRIYNGLDHLVLEKTQNCHRTLFTNLNNCSHIYDCTMPTTTSFVQTFIASNGYRNAKSQDPFYSWRGAWYCHTITYCCPYKLWANLQPLGCSMREWLLNRLKDSSPTSNTKFEQAKEFEWKRMLMKQANLSYQLFADCKAKPCSTILPSMICTSLHILLEQWR